MKKVAIGLIVVLLVILGVVFYFGSQASSIIQKTVVDYGPEVTGTSIGLEGVDVSFLGGTAGLSGLVIGNPAGFKSDHAFKLGSVDVALDVKSVMSDIIHIKEVRIDGADLIYEIGTKGNNISKLQNNVQQYMAKFGSSDESTKSFVIDDIYVTGTKVQLATDLLGGKGAGLTLPDIHLEDIGKEGSGASGAEVMNKVLGAVNSGLSKVVTKDMMNKTLEDVGSKLKGLIK
ncbi:AsmA family protein [Emcibacter sp.]|uniref:AsmA family protein n=1 Tax=Emcibacter sp. TaxID=1979954 RepID=UPI002AA81CED|nr:AsmA family protein [Emcibacter sp.]